MKFTKKEISLCKQVAEKHRREIKYGDWFYLNEAENYYLWMHGFARIDIPKEWFPLWTISDCLEFLEKKCSHYVRLRHDEHDEQDGWFLWFDEYHETEKEGYGKTPLEACLKIVLAVLKEE